MPYGVGLRLLVFALLVLSVGSVGGELMVLPIKFTMGFALHLQVDLDPD